MRAPHVLSSFSMVLALVACGERRFTSADDAKVRSVLRAQQDAWNRGDLDGYMRGYVRGARLLFTSGGNIRRGWDETYAKYKAKYGSDRSTMGTLAFEIVDVTPVGADGAVVLGKWDLTNTPSAGAGVFSVVLERTRDGWQVVHDHTTGQPASSSPPPPVTAP